MGPVFLPRIAADTLGWAIIAAVAYPNGYEKGQCFCIEVLLMPLNGPIIAADDDYRWPRMGRVFLRRNAANAIEWAHYRC